MSPKIYYKKLLHLFQENSVPEQIAPMESYMKNHFDYFGIKSPARKLLLKDFVKENGIPEGEELQQIVALLWEDPHREMQYAAMEILDKRLRKMDISFLPFLEKLILKKSWWDTVDWIAAKACGIFFQKYPEQILPITETWNHSENIWLQRSSILFQLKYKEQTDFDLLKKYVLYGADSKEFFIRKGAGWALREYAKSNPTAVAAFVMENKTVLSNLTIREALKHIEG
ncbi:MAG: 3-methyladenine DNA glycosylase AlkD [Saprospiraceae bacterium]|jgi:3-methyladenine DNA glycosylase AlkD